MVTRGEIFRYFVTISHELPRYFFVRLMLKFLDILPEFSRWFASIFCRQSHGEYYKHFLGASRSALLFCWISYGEFSPHFVPYPRSIMSIFCGHIKIKYVDILSDDTRRIIWIFFGHLTLNYLDILSDVPLWIFPTFCRMSYGKLRPYFFGGLTVNNLNILPEISQWIFSPFRVAFHSDYSR